jgi:hypothetical protein
VDDPEVIEAFLEQGSGTVFGPSLHFESAILKLDGWWPVAYRVSDRTVLVRDEQAPTESTALADVGAALAARGLSAVGADLPAMTLLTYTSFDLGYAPWVLWSTDLATGETDLNAKASEESFLGNSSPAGPFAQPDNTDSARSARRLAGAPSRLVLAVGVSDEYAMPLRDSLEDCRFESRAFGEIEPTACVSLLPTLILVDATGPAGSAFLVELRSGHAVSAPVVAITGHGEMRAGVDATVDATDPPGSWVQLIRDLLR